MEARVEFKRSDIYKRTIDAAKLETETRRLVPGGSPSFAASAEKNLHFCHQFNDFGDVLSQILSGLKL